METQIGNRDRYYISGNHKIGKCEVCDRTIGTEIKRTALHHYLYDTRNPVNYTIELCDRCHTHFHTLSGEPGETHRNKIKVIVEKKYGKIPDPLPEFLKPGNTYPERKKKAANQQIYTVGQDALTPLEYEKVCDACSSIEDEALVKFTVATGMRREDVVNVERQNIDLASGSVTFSEKKKGGRIRTIYIGQKLCTLLIKYLKTVPKDQKLLFGFCGKTAYNKLQDLCDVAGIRRRPFHALRATCVKRCQAAKWTPEQVCKLTGDTLRVIQEHYATPSDSEMGEVAKASEII